MEEERRRVRGEREKEEKKDKEYDVCVGQMHIRSTNELLNANPKAQLTAKGNV